MELCPLMYKPKGYRVSKRQKENLKNSHLKPPKQIGKSLNKIAHDKAVRVLGSKCVRCGFDDIRALQIDHINGGGSQAVKRSGHSHYYAVARGETSGFQLLCANCNWIKR